MGRVGNPFPEAPVGLGIDCDCIGCIGSALLRDDDAMGDPVMHDPQADAVLLADLRDGEGMLGGQGAGIRCL